MNTREPKVEAALAWCWGRGSHYSYAADAAHEYASTRGLRPVSDYNGCLEFLARDAELPRFYMEAPAPAHPTATEKREELRNEVANSGDC